MKWYVDKFTDSLDELHERMRFYSDLTGRNLIISEITDGFYLLCDGRNDNLCMVIGHTDLAFKVIEKLKRSSPKHYKLYLSVCGESVDYLAALCIAAKGYEVFITEQEKIEIEGVNRWGCKFYPKSETGFGFKLTKSEIAMYNSEYKGFFIRLDKSFILLQKRLSPTSPRRSNGRRIK